MTEVGAPSVDRSPVPKAATSLFTAVFGPHLGQLEGLIRGGRMFETPPRYEPTTMIA